MNVIYNETRDLTRMRAIKRTGRHERIFDSRRGWEMMLGVGVEIIDLYPSRPVTSVAL